MIVVDASAAVQALLHDQVLRRRLARQRLAAPHLIDAEVLHSLRRLSAGRTLSDDAGGELVRQWQRMDVRRFAVRGLAERIWALRFNLSAYDACYVALAEELGCTLVTADARLASSPVEVGCTITQIPR